MSQRNGGMFDWQKSSLYRVALLLTVSGCVALVTLGAVGDAPWKPGDPIGYISQKIPKVSVPPYKGDKYQATVPDTLDLAERARISINALTEVTNPDEDFEIYNTNTFATNPPS